MRGTVYYKRVDGQSRNVENFTHTRSGKARAPSQPALPTLACVSVAARKKNRCGNVNVNVNNLPAIFEQDCEDLGEAGPQASGVKHMETPLRQLHMIRRASSCAKRGGPVQLCSCESRGARRLQPEIFRRRGQLLSHPPITGQCDVVATGQCVN